jgi:hypothetical protein
MAQIRSSVSSPANYPYSVSATFIVGELHEAVALLTPESDAQGVVRWRDAVDLALALLEGESGSEGVAQALASQIALHALAGSAAGLEEWRAKLSRKKSEVFRETLQQTVRTYRRDLTEGIAAMCRRGSDGLRSPGERLRVIVAFLTDPWAREVTGDSYIMLHSLVGKGAVTPGELVGAAKEIIAADADNGRRARELAAFAWDAGRKDLAKGFLDQAAAGAKGDKLPERYRLAGAEAK